jgi:hypothetical protein
MEAQPIIDIISGVAALLGLIGIPAAALVLPISSILNGIFGLRKKRE